MFPIYINNEEYIITDKHLIDSGSSGTCYHLENQNLNLAVKIYHTSDSRVAKMFGKIVFPDEKVLNKLIDVSAISSPILLSQYVVRDKNGSYIGCARDFIESQYSSDDCIQAFFQFPKEKIFSYLQNIQSNISILDTHHIRVNDWIVDNSLFGTKDGVEGLYIFDDSDYFISDDILDFNYLAFNDFIADFVDGFLVEDSYQSVKPYILRQLDSYSNAVDFLKQVSDSYETIGDGLTFHANKVKRKYF